MPGKAMNPDQLKTFETERDFIALMMRQAEEARAKRTALWASGPAGSREKIRSNGKVNAEINHSPAGI
jgi:hypothetical protein